MGARRKTKSVKRKSVRSLAEYERKRHFAKTPEPRGDGRARAGRSFVIHKHAARRLHYDLRLEHRGVLMSWAVPKGPSFDPTQRRLAVQVEDHPLEYGKFEGAIPEGEYGAGEVIVWDRGTWEPDGDVDAMLAKGHLKFRLVGQKLRGGWNLLRMEPRGRDDGRLRSDKPQWLLVKQKDEIADPSRDVVVEEPRSVVSRRSIEPRVPKHARARNGRHDGSVRLPSVDFELATLVTEPPAGDEWLHETKWDGVRLLAVMERGRVGLFTRNGKEWSHRVPTIAAAVAKLRAKKVVLDGEAVALDGRGVSRFQLLQRAALEKSASPLFVAFDLLALDDEDLRERPLEQRKQRLARLLGDDERATIRYCQHVVGDGPRRLALACRDGLEGIVSKRRDAPYAGGRGRAWYKSKCSQRQEFVIAGWTEPAGARDHFGALLLGVHDEHGELRDAGRVGSGFDVATLKQLHRTFRPLAVAKSPLVDPPPARRVHWLDPRLVAEVSFTEWTAEGRLRHPVFVGLRDDKPASEIVREKATPPRVRGATNGAPPAADESETSVLGVAITHGDRLVIPQSDVTKLVLARYLAAVGERMEPHLRDRPLALLRCVRGSYGPCFFQKHLDEAIDGITSVDVGRRSVDRGADGRRRSANHGVDGASRGAERELQPVVRSTKGLVALAQRSVVELHLWGSRADDLERPDRVVFDLDPAGDVAWKDVVVAAHEVRELLRQADLASFAMATGGKGVHVIAPLRRQWEWDAVKAFAASIANVLVTAAPQRYVAKAAKAARSGRIFVDWLRNGRGATAIAPFSPRARAGAPVATPIRWEELDDVRPDSFHVSTIAQRLAATRRDPWAKFFELRQSPSAGVMRRLAVVTNSRGA